MLTFLSLLVFMFVQAMQMQNVVLAGWGFLGVFSSRVVFFAYFPWAPQKPR